MPTVNQDKTEEINVDDLPSLASLAAVELDELVAGREVVQTGAVRRLASALASWMHSEGSESPTVQLDQRRLFVINRAFDDSGVVSTRPTTVDDLIQTTGEVTRLLLEVGSVPFPNVEGLERLRSFCLALSCRAASLVYGSEEGHQRHPYCR